MLLLSPFLDMCMCMCVCLCDKTKQTKEWCEKRYWRHLRIFLSFFWCFRSNNRLGGAVKYFSYADMQASWLTVLSDTFLNSYSSSAGGWIFFFFLDTWSQPPNPPPPSLAVIHEASFRPYAVVEACLQSHTHRHTHIHELALSLCPYALRCVVLLLCCLQTCFFPSSRHSPHPTLAGLPSINYTPLICAHKKHNGPFSHNATTAGVLLMAPVWL